MTPVIHGCTLLDVVGTVRTFRDIRFVPATVWFHRPTPRAGHFLQNHVKPAPDGSVLPPEEFSDSFWVRAALPAVFGFAPLHVADDRRYLLDCPFLAVVEDGGKLHAYPFACTDADGPTGLTFAGSDGPDIPTRVRIARAFWDLLVLEGGGDLCSFDVDEIDLGGEDGYKAVAGYRNGEFFAYEPHEADWESEEGEE